MRVATSSSPPQNALHSSRLWCIEPLCLLFPLYVYWWGGQLWMQRAPDGAVQRQLSLCSGCICSSHAVIDGAQLMTSSCTESIPPSDPQILHSVVTTLTLSYQLIPRPSHTGYCAITTNGRFTRPFFRCKLNLSHGRMASIWLSSCTPAS